MLSRLGAPAMPALLASHRQHQQHASCGEEESQPLREQLMEEQVGQERAQGMMKSLSERTQRSTSPSGQPSLAGMTYIEPSATPDLVIVLPYPWPTDKVTDADDEVSDVEEVLKSILVADHEVDRHFPELGALLKERTSRVTMGKMRLAFLHDLCSLLEGLGCVTRPFKSCDGDELFLRITLGEFEVDGRRISRVATLAKEMRYRLQTTKDIVAALGVDQPEAEISPAYLAYDSVLEKRLEEKRGVPLFQRHGEEDSVFRTVDRLRLLNVSLEKWIDLADCQNHGLIKTAYPVHRQALLRELGARWANFSLRTVLCPDQPVQEIRNYFGEWVAFYFLWLGFTARFLALLAPGGILLSICLRRYAFDAPSEWPEAAIVAASSLFLFLWSTFYTKYWTRLQNHYKAEWDMLDDDAHFSKTARPDYRGELLPSPVDFNMHTKQYPVVKGNVVYILSRIITLGFMAGVAAIVMWLFTFEPMLNERFGMVWGARVHSLVIALQITVTGAIWEKCIVDRLVELENPMTEGDYRHALVVKLYPFSFISTYASLYYHSFLSSWAENCSEGEGDCYAARLNATLYMVTIPATVTQFILMMLPYMKLKLDLWLESRALDHTAQRSFMETQAKQPYFGAKEVSQDINVMVLQLGFLLQFGSMAPGIVLVVFVSFLLKIRMDAFKLCNIYQRTTPMAQAARGIGAWNHIVEFIALAGSATAVGIPLFNLRCFRSLSLAQKFIAFFCTREGLHLLRGLIHSLIPDVAPATELLRARRSHVVHKLQHGEHADERTSPGLRGLVQSFIPSVAPATELLRARCSHVVNKLQHGERADERWGLRGGSTASTASTAPGSARELPLASIAPDWSEEVKPLDERHPDWKAVEKEDEGEVLTFASKRSLGP